MKCCRCGCDCSTAGYRLDGRTYCPPCSWHAEPAVKQLGLFDEKAAQ